MSVEAIAIALHHSRATGTAKLVLIGIANHDGDGGAWPAVDTLARYAGVSRRNVQKALATLEQLGEIKRIFQAGGDHSIADHRRPNRYRIMLSCPLSCDRTAQHRTGRETLFDDLSTGVSESTPGAASDAGRGVASDTQTVPLNSTTDRRKVTLVDAGARDLCVPPFRRHDFAPNGACTHACGVYADGRVEDPKTGRVLVEADEVFA